MYKTASQIADLVLIKCAWPWSSKKKPQAETAPQKSTLIPSDYMGKDWAKFPMGDDILAIKNDQTHHLWDAPPEATKLDAQLEYLKAKAPEGSWTILQRPPRAND